LSGVDEAYVAANSATNPTIRTIFLIGAVGVGVLVMLGFAVLVLTIRQRGSSRAKDKGDLPPPP